MATKKPKIRLVFLISCKLGKKAFTSRITYAVHKKLAEEALSAGLAVTEETWDTLKNMPMKLEELEDQARIADAADNPAQQQRMQEVADRKAKQRANIITTVDGQRAHAKREGKAMLVLGDDGVIRTEAPHAAIKRESTDRTGSGDREPSTGDSHGGGDQDDDSGGGAEAGAGTEVIASADGGSPSGDADTGGAAS